MKGFAIVILILFSVSPAFSQNAVQRDSIVKMADREKSDCTKFKRMEGRDRYDQFCKIMHLFPSGRFIMLANNTMKLEEESVSFYMSVKQLSDLLGKPIMDKKTMVYILVPNGCSVQFAKTKAGGVCFVSFSNCQE